VLRLPFAATLFGIFSRRRCHNSNKTSTHIHDIFYFGLKHSFVQTVVSPISCILSICNFATMEAALLQAVAQDESNVVTIRFNNRRYGSWQAARDPFNQLKNKKGGNSVWSKLTLVPMRAHLSSGASAVESVVSWAILLSGRRNKFVRDLRTAQRAPQQDHPTTTRQGCSSY
jgi:hypothetical protein